MTFPPVVCQVLLAVVAGIAAIYDIRFRRIPNWLTLAGLVAGLGLQIFLFRWPGARSSMEGVGLALLIYFPLYLLRAMGAGDVKLMAAIGSMVGPADWLGIFLLTAVLGGGAALGLLLARGKLAGSLFNIGFLIQRLASLKAPYAREELDISSPKSLKLPHGVAIAGGTALFLAAAWLLAPR